ncbi:MAG: hypothetical protein NDI61_14660, partial [Bdellovibrionaceae bacterium]|nr:hypothetical protein [Pseudobdellovibrionaceae bacterium]
MDRYLVAGAVCLLLLEIFILAADFGDVALDSSRAPWATGQRIGDLKRAENEVRRRGRSSLVWDESQTQDALFAYDSVLTLKDSTAQIRLRAPSDPHASGQTNAQITPQETQDTILNLDENTLVVLEPTEESQSGSLRLRFSRGAFRARNPSQAMNIETRSFSLDAKPGTELSLVGLENGNFEVELSRGEATLTTPNGVERVTSGERVRLSQEEIVERAQVSEGLQWGRDIPDRIYARQFPVPVPLSWNGLATDAEIIAPDKSIRLIHLQDPSTLTVEFPHGTSLVRLRNGDQSSSTATIQVRHAPSFQYFTPLPRDRARTGTDLLFSWQRLPEAHSYRLELSADATFDSLVTSVPTKDTRVTTPLRKSGTYFWRIVGLDADGYAIPAPRAYPLYITPQPLQAPELQTPELREPADAGEESDGSASLWNWILPLARAQTASSLSATFTWGAVSGADHYVIEISRTPGFEDPLVLQKVTETKFTWVGFAIGNYFWRVAAGSGSGPTEQLGLFSAPALARLDPRHANAGKGVTLAASEPPQVSPPVRQPLPEPSTARAARHQPAPSPPTPPVQLTQIAADTKPESREPKPEPPSLVSSVDAPTDPAPSSSTDTSETVDELRPGERKIRPRILASPRYGKK